MSDLGRILWAEGTVVEAESVGEAPEAGAEVQAAAELGAKVQAAAELAVELQVDAEPRAVVESEAVVATSEIASLESNLGREAMRVLAERHLPEEQPVGRVRTERNDEKTRAPQPEDPTQPAAPLSEMPGEPAATVVGPGTPVARAAGGTDPRAEVARAGGAASVDVREGSVGAAAAVGAKAPAAAAAG